MTVVMHSNVIKSTLLLQEEKLTFLLIWSILIMQYLELDTKIM